MPISPEIQQLLNQLNDVITPEPVGWFPLSFSLMAFITGLTGIIVGIVWTLLVSRRNNQYRREASSLFDKAIKQANSPEQKIEIANSLLKQVAITNYGRQNVAKLSGKKWIQFLKQNANYIEQPDYLTDYFNAHYQPDFEFDEAKLSKVLDYVQSWIKGHHK
jgi:hypothetical protein